MSPLPPALLDARSVEDVTAQLRHHLAWPEERNDPLANALIAAFAHYAGLLRQRLNEAPQRQLEAFVDLLGPDRFGAVPAHTVLAFKPVVQAASASVVADIKPGTQVAGITPPGASEPVVFETLAALAPSTAQIVSAVVTDAGPTRRVDAAASKADDLGVPPLDTSAHPIVPALHFAVPTSALAAAPATLHLRVTVDGDAGAGSALRAEWSLRGEKGAIEAAPETDGTDGLSQSGELMWRDLPAWGETALGQRRAPWLSCRFVPEAGGGPPVMSRAARRITSAALFVRRELPPQAIEAAFFGNAPLDPSRGFLPLGDRPRFADVFVAQAEAFAQPGAQVKLEVRLAPGPKADALAHPPTLQWEAWTQRGWVPLSPQDGTQALTRGGTLQFTLPHDTQATTLQGRSGGFVRAHLVRGDYALPAADAPVAARDAAAAVAAAAAGFLISNHRPPVIARMTVSATVETPPAEAPVVVREQGFEAAAFAAPLGAGLPLPTPAGAEPAALYLGLRRAILGVERLQLVLSMRADTAGAELPRCQYRGVGRWVDALVEATAVAHPDLPAATLHLGADWATWPESSLDPALHWLRLLPAEVEATSPPPIDRVLLNAVPALQRRTIENEVLGSSSGLPSQSFALAFASVLGEPVFEVAEPGPLPQAEHDALVEAGGPQAVRVEPALGSWQTRAWVRWERVHDFSASDPFSRHYVLDAHAGRIRLGDGRRGRIPPLGPNNLVMRHYRTGGGAAGNCVAGQVRQLRSTLPYVEAVEQPVPALGGQDAESPSAARGAAIAWLRHRDRAVGPDDYEDLACRATPEMLRAQCLPARDLCADPLGRQHAPGCVSLVLIPRDPLSEAPRPSSALVARVRAFLAERCAAGVRLMFSAPLYVAANVDLEVRALPGFDPAALERDCGQRLTSFLHPATGGSEGDGWAFGRWPFASELRGALRDTPGIAEVRLLHVVAAEDLAGSRQAPHALVRAGYCRVKVTCHVRPSRPWL